MDKLEASIFDSKTELDDIRGQLSVIVDQTKDNTSVNDEMVKLLAEEVAKASNFKNFEKAILEVKDDVAKLNVVEVLDTNKKILSQLDTVGTVCDTFKEGLSRLEKVFENDRFKDVADNSAKSADALVTMNRNMEAFMAKMETTAKEPAKPNNENTKAEVSTPTEVTNKAVSASSTGVKNVKLFTCSVTLHCDKAELELGLNCKLDVVKTFHIKKHPEAEDPDLYLERLIDASLGNDTDTDFIVIAVGSNDISRLSIEDDDISTLTDKVCEQSSALVDLAKYAAEKYNIEVFVLERPPRYDKESNDPKAMKQRLSQTANGFMMSLIVPLDHVHLVRLPDLDNLHPKAKKGVYQHDGIHLTKRG